MILFLFRNDRIGGESRLSFFYFVGFVILLYYYYIFIILFLSSFCGSYLLQKADFKIDILSVLKIYFLSILKIYLTAILKSTFHRFWKLHRAQSKFLQNSMLSRLLPLKNFPKIRWQKIFLKNVTKNQETFWLNYTYIM